MDQDWTKVDFRNASQVPSEQDDQLRLAQEVLARDLSINLSAFLRTTITVAYSAVEETLFGAFFQADDRSCFSLALVRPAQHKILVQAEHSGLYPLIGIALGAKAGSFPSQERKPTEIELQVVNMVVRLILSEAYRSWTPLVGTQMDTVTLEIERTPGRAFAESDPVIVIRFELAVGESSGKLALIAPAQLFNARTAKIEPEPEPALPPGSLETMLDLMMAANVRVDVWLDGSEMRLGDLLRLREGQIVKLDHPLERKVVCKLNGTPGFIGQIVSTGTKRAFMIDEAR